MTSEPVEPAASSESVEPAASSEPVAPQASVPGRFSEIGVSSDESGTKAPENGRSPKNGSDTFPATRPWWLLLVAALAIAGIAFAIGRFSTFGPADAGPLTPTSDSPEAGFARDMQVHHAQAIDLAMTAYRKTGDDDVRLLAYDIATTQSAQKGEFSDWLVKWGLPQAGGPLMGWMTDAAAGHDHGDTAADAASEAELMAAMGMATPEELAALDAATGTAADCLFLSLMIRHHEGALPMAEALLELGHDPRALQVADGVVATQSAEIDLMRSLQARLACTG